jgi:hypothetical protein
MNKSELKFSIRKVNCQQAISMVVKNNYFGWKKLMSWFYCQWWYYWNTEIFNIKELYGFKFAKKMRSIIQSRFHLKPFYY